MIGVRRGKVTHDRFTHLSLSLSIRLRGIFNLWPFQILRDAAERAGIGSADLAALTTNSALSSPAVAKLYHKLLNNLLDRMDTVDDSYWQKFNMAAQSQSQRRGTLGAVLKTPRQFLTDFAPRETTMQSLSSSQRRLKLNRRSKSDRLYI